MTFPLPGANWSYLHGLTLKATTGFDGFTLQNATPTILTWTPPDDGELHWVTCACILDVTSAETGGIVNLDGLSPNLTAWTRAQFSALGTGVWFSASLTLVPVPGGQAVTLSQATPLTAGTAVLWGGIWGL